MYVRAEVYHQLKSELSAKGVTLVAVSKTKPVEEIRKLYEWGQLDFGENYAGEMQEKAKQLPADIRWHYIGHLQSNKVKLIAPFVQLIQGVDSLKLLEEIGRQAGKTGRTIDCLLQVYIADEETKFGLRANELETVMKTLSEREIDNIRVRGLMGMASFTSNQETIRKEFRNLKSLYDQYRVLKNPAFSFDTLSMGMSADYLVAIEEGSNMVRIGSLLFGERALK
jgi:pyridoxal phosphate enzyme (YggS family)